MGIKVYLQFALLLLSAALLAFPSMRSQGTTVVLFALYTVVSAASLYRAWADGWFHCTLAQLHGKAKTSSLEGLSCIVGTIAVVTALARS